MNVPKFDDSKKTHLTLEIYSIGRKKNNQDRETLKKERERKRGLKLEVPLSVLDSNITDGGRG